MVAGPPGHVIQLSWMSFHLEASPSCMFDYVAVFDNSTIPNTGDQATEYTRPHTGGLVGKYCGASNPPSMTTTENMLSLQFKR